MSNVVYLPTNTSLTADKKLATVSPFAKLPCFLWTKPKNMSKFVQEHVAGGTQFQGGMLLTDLCDTSLLVQPLGVLPLEEEQVPGATRIGEWVSVLCPMHRTYAKGSRALPGCQLQFQTKDQLAQAQGLTEWVHNLTLTLTLPMHKHPVPCLPTLGLLHIWYQFITVGEEVGMELELWFAHPLHAALACLAIPAWLPSIPVQALHHLELSNNYGFLHPLCNMSACCTDQLPPYHVQAAHRDSATDMVPQLVWVVQVADGEYMLKIGFNTPLEAAHMLGTQKRSGKQQMPMPNNALCTSIPI